nr:GBS Bsp-like repeat-containing protein [uncultured Dorea sp.]
MKRKIAVFLSALMLWSTVVGSVNAAAAEGQENSNTIVETQNDNEDTSTISQDDSGVNNENENSNTQNQIGNVEENSTLTDNSNEEQPVINYLAVDQGYLQSPGEQQIVVSFGKGTENIEQPRLSFQKSDGTVTEFTFVKKDAELFLFSHDFSAEEKGVYSAKTFTYILNGVENSVDLETIGVNAKFGVDVVYEGYEAGNSDINTEQEVEASVVDVESGRLVSASTDIAATLSETESAISAESMEGRTVRSRNKVVVLDPGHGGSDGGAAANGLVEKNLTLKIAQYCKEELEKYSGVTVYMTRNTDVAVGLEERVQMAKNWGADVFVSIHMNSASPAATGAEVWYPNSSYNSEIHNNGQKLASDIENELVSLGLANRGVKIRNSESGSKYSDGSIADYYSVIRNSKLAGFPGIIVEHAFLTNSADAEKLKQESFIKKMGIADATGIAKYFNLSKEEDSGKFTASVIKKNDFARTFTVKINGKLSDGESYRVAVWSNKNGQDPNNLWTIVNKQSGNDVEINYNTANYKNADGIYNIHIYKCDKNEKVTCVQTMTCNMYNSSASCKVQDTTGEEKNFKASAEITNVPDTLNRIQFAVWSDQNGQDDLNWYTGTKSGNVWSTNITVKNYKRYGKYNVHTYAVLNDGTSVFLKAMSFNVTEPTAKLTVEKQNDSNGTAEVTISNIQSKSGINSVLVPVWSQENQSDLVWYTAQKQSNGSYKITIDMGNHNYNEGTYRIACYIVDGNEIQTGIASTTCEMKLPNTYLNVKDAAGTEKEFQITLGNASVYGNIRQVQFAVWSVQGGQDDLVWYGAEKKNAGTWTKTVKIRDHRTLGTYNVHAYITLANGSVKTKTTTFNVSRPTAKLTVGTQDKEKGTTEVTVSNIQSKSGISAVLIPVWSQGNQSDLVWYTAQKQSNGTYKITIDMGNHNYNEGTYQIACYIVDGNGIQTGITSGSCQMKAPNIYLEAKDAAETEKEFQISLTNAGVYGNIRQVQFAVWSVQGGQDDLIWYGAEKKNAGTWTKMVKIKDHRTFGTYNVHAYITLANGSVKTKTTTFNVSRPTGIISVSEYNESGGTFNVTINNIKSASGVEAVMVPVWCASDQSDLVWYQATKINSTTYKATVNIANHKKHTGTYKINVYLETGNGMQVGIGGCTQEIKNTGLYAIMGHSDVTIAQMVAYYKKNNLTYDQYSGSLSQYNGVLAKGGAANIEIYCTIFKQEAEAEGVRVEVAFAQAMLETGFLKFGGDVKPNQYNFAGIGATGGVPGNEFSDVREGIRAQIQHLKCYASDAALNNPCVDPRWGSWLRNKAPYVQWLSKANNPYGIGWATDAGYAEKLLNMIKNLKIH